MNWWNYSWTLNGSKTERLILGGGSNMLFKTDFDGLVIRVNIRGIEHRISKNEIFVAAGGGEVWNDLVNFCVAANMPDLKI